MPLLRRQPFVKEKPPPDLRGDEEVFLCKLTNEIFRDYEEFFERIILCNSLVWSCSITGRAGLTYQEALESEEKGLKNLATFPGFLQKTILYLATLTHRSRLADLNDDIFVFAKDRFFIGEVVDATINGERKPCIVLRVLPPTAAKNESDCIVIESDDEDESSKNKNGLQIHPDQFRYVVREKGDSSLTLTVTAKQLSRKKGLYTRDKSKLFLKQYCEPVNGTWKVKNEVIQKKAINKITFLDIFAGPMPIFEKSEAKRKSGPNKKEDGPSAMSEFESRKKKKKEEKLRKEKMKAQEVAQETIQLTNEEKAALREQEKQQKVAEKMAKKEEMKQKMLEEKIRQKEEKAKERLKLIEEKRLQAEYYKEWSRPRDDMDCDDLKVLPEPVPISMKIPSDCFGEAVMVIEFINCFKVLFDLKEYFPKGFTFDILEKALLETDHNGVLTDILLMMMTAIFSLQEAEEEEEEEFSKSDKTVNVLAFGNITDATTNELVESASMFSKIPLKNHGCLLKKLPLDSFTLSEILRLHLLAAGALGKDKNAKYRFQQRGGYTPYDDPGLDFRRQEPALLKKMELESLFDMPPSDRLKILKVLINQFLTYAATRDNIDDNLEAVRQLKLEFRQMQWAEIRREREEAAARYKRRLEEKMKDKEKMEQKRQKKIEETVQRLKLQEAGLPVPPVKDDSEEEAEDSVNEQEKEDVRQQEEEEEANKKAEYALQEKKAYDEIAQLQLSTTIAPLGRDRLFRRYWLFPSLAGLFIEENEDMVPEAAFRPVPQVEDLNNPLDIKNINYNTKVQNKKPATETKKKPKEHENGSSDKENDSMNTSVNDTSNTGDVSQETANSDTQDKKGNSNNESAPTSNGGKSDDVVLISDGDDDGDDEDEDDDESSDNEETELPPLDLENPAINQIVNRARYQWSYIASEEQFEELLKSLNPRGMREGPLRTALNENRSRIISSIEKCPQKQFTFQVEEETEVSRSNTPDIVNGGHNLRVRKMNKGLIKGDSAQEVLEINLRELLLDLEERIFVGSLGSVKVNDRLAWRHALEHGNYDPQTDDPIFAKEKKEEKMEHDGEENASSSSDDSAESTIKDLAKALLQIRRAVDYKYLVPPLGDSEKLRQKYKESKMEEFKKKQMEDGEESDGDTEGDVTPSQRLTERWEKSLLLCTSLSQVFLHMATLEKSIAWSKSALHARCKICRRKGDAEQMLLCDMCDRGHHMYCLKPRLKVVPAGDWFCPDCRPKEVKRSPLKKRRKTFTDDEEEEVEEEEEEEEDEEEESNEDEEDDKQAFRDEHDSLCAVCSKAGMLICCDACPLSFHLNCAKPPLKKVPKGKWLCQMCSGEGKQGLIKFPKAGGKKKGANKSTPSSSRSNSRRGSPRESPVTVISSRKRGRAESPLTDENPKSKMKKSGRSMSKLADASDETEIKHYTSSSRGNSKVQSLKQCADIIAELTKHSDSEPFLKPVSKKLVPDYYDIIQNPMDFLTIKNKINRFEYDNVTNLISDVRLVFSNCAEYNRKSAPEYKAGQFLSKLFEKRLKEHNIVEINEPPSKKSRRTL